ncbi:MAG: tRNA 2-thiocytidine(32) synthetase TtcA [Deltaproteobacteria bacterium]|nr:tRNA 2-thiocytidine(32) synthetase TtcA [Deltaproteobacteria bacterium]
MLIQITEPLARRAPSAEEGGAPPAPAPAPIPTKEISRLVFEAVSRFSLIAPGDRVAVGCSGGKDSLLLICALEQLRRREDLPFTLQVIHLDQQQPGFDRAGFDAALARLGVPCEVITRDTWSVVEQQRRPGQIPCAVCGRLRRGILNRWCAERGYSKLALGHHLDDALETFFLNLLFGRTLDPLKPATPASDEPVTTIRPLLFVEERRVEAWVAQSGLRPIDCPVCDSFPDAKRRDLKQLLRGLADAQPELYASARAAIYGEGSPFSLAALTSLAPRGLQAP